MWYQSIVGIVVRLSCSSPYLLRRLSSHPCWTPCKEGDQGSRYFGIKQASIKSATMRRPIVMLDDDRYEDQQTHTIPTDNSCSDYEDYSNRSRTIQRRGDRPRNQALYPSYFNGGPSQVSNSYIHRGQNDAHPEQTWQLEETNRGYVGPNRSNREVD